MHPPPVGAAVGADRLHLQRVTPSSSARNGMRPLAASQTVTTCRARWCGPTPQNFPSMCFMRISDAHEVLFVHVEKTGGSTIDAMMDREVPDVRSIDVARHAPLRRVLSVEPALRSYWICGLVRNPWERMVSWWAMVCEVRMRAEAGDPECLYRMKVNPNFWEPVCQYDNFETFLARGTEEVPRLRRPQVDYLRTKDRRVDFIGRMERFDADVGVIRSHLDLSRLADLPNENTSAHGDYRDYYAPSTRAFVGQVFAKDIAAFGYTFDPPRRGLIGGQRLRRVGKALKTRISRASRAATSIDPP